MREHHLERLDVYAAALYLFLITVADVRGLSWYADTSVARRLSIDEVRLRRARMDLVQCGLVAYAAPLYQVLDLDGPWEAPAARGAAQDASPQAERSTTTRAEARGHLAKLHGVLGRAP